MATTRPIPLPLPFDDEVEAAVPFVLTAAAHREVLGREVPSLTVVPDGPGAIEDEEAVADTRRLQARALLRSGMPPSTIAAALGVDVDRIAAWTEDLGDELARRRRARARRGQGPGSASSVAITSPSSHTDEEPVADAARLAAGLAYAIAESDGASVTIVHDRLGPVGVLLDALRAVHDVAPDRIRVAVRIPAGGAADRARATVATRLGVDPGTVTIGRDASSSGPDLALRVDVRDAGCAALVEAWRAGEELRGWDSNPQTFRLTADCSAS